MLTQSEISAILKMQSEITDKHQGTQAPQRATRQATGREGKKMKSSISVKVQYSGGKPFVITNGARTFLQNDLSCLPTAFNVNGEWYLKLDVIKFK